MKVVRFFPVSIPVLSLVFKSFPGWLGAPDARGLLMAPGALNRGPWRPSVAATNGAAPRGGAYVLLQQQLQEHEQQARQQHLQWEQQQHRPKVTVSQHADSPEDEANARFYEAEAKIEVTAQCRSRDEVFQALKEAIRIRPLLSRKHRELLANTVKAMVSDYRSSYYIISGAHAVLLAAGPAWRTAKEKGAPAAACRAAAAAAAGLTLAGVSPSEAAETAADTAVSKGLGATRNLVARHKVYQQRQQSAAAAAAALQRAQAAAAAAADDDSSTGEPEGDAPSPLLPPSSSSSNGDGSSSSNSSSSSDKIGNAPDSAAARIQGLTMPQQLLETVTAEAVLPYQEYFIKRLEAFLRRLISEVRELAHKIHNIVNCALLPAADSTEAKVFYLQLNADVSRYVSQVVTDSEECEHFRKQSLGFYRNALALFEQSEQNRKKERQTSQQEGEDTPEVPLSVKMGLVLNYAVLLHDEPGGAQQAIAALAAQFREAVETVVHIADAEEGRRVMMVMSLLRGNVEAWCQEVGRDDATTLLGLNDSSGLL
ncbi:14-3-3 protein, putative [Eimeria brunetti]|uniref:14-3-3 protein, putative n=1 Tax=Eimeria brunetti TaxID=51314 RepID=U6LY82_9EIME|nr:14-3-3 protein, putative [Eimeria brunetti]